MEKNEQLNKWVKVERKEHKTNFIKWDTLGFIVEGVLLRVETETEFKSNKYTIDTNTGRVVFFGTTILDNLLSNCVEGDYIKIIYTGEEKHSKPGYSPIKTFDVFTRG
jgi:hypothetical protein